MSAMQNIKRALFALVATMVVAVGAIGAPTPAEARTEYWCERTLADRVEQHGVGLRIGQRRGFAIRLLPFRAGQHRV